MIFFPIAPDVLNMMGVRYLDASALQRRTSVQEGDRCLTSAVLTEQSAILLLRAPVPMFRKCVLWCR